MTLPMVTCPLCCQPGFNTSDALCSALVTASTRKFVCPVCNEMLIGLEKLTIHLFGHNNRSQTPVINSGCQSKMLVAPNNADGPVLYIQADGGQLFAVAPHSLLNQFSTVTINTQNYINSGETKSALLGNTREKILKSSEFSSCKDLLTSGDFSEPSGELDEISGPQSPAKIAGCVQTGETPSDSVRENSRLDEAVAEIPSKILGDSRENSPRAPESPKQLVPCDVCDLGFSNKAILAVHKQLMHKNHVASETDFGVPRSPEKSKRKPFSCSWCSSTFNLKSSLMIHVKVTHPAQRECFERKEAEKLACPVCDTSFPKESALNQHMKTAHGEKPWQCSVCSKSFTTKYFLKKHKRIHTGETPYECAICHKVFTFQQSYHKHMLYHTDDKPYCCSHCGRLFKELSTLNNHERIHSGEKPFSCETCGKSFRQRVSYLVHRRIHTGAMPYKCTACNKSFRYKISQRTHKCPEHPPGVVVKTHNSLMDRLQAVISQEETNSVHVQTSISLDQTTNMPSEVRNLEDTNRNVLNFSTSHTGSEALEETDLTNLARTNCSAEGIKPTSGPEMFNAVMPGNCSSNTCNVQEVVSCEGTKLEMNVDRKFPSHMEFSGMTEERGTNKTLQNDDVLSMNLDSSPSESLGKLHISSNEYQQNVIDLSESGRSTAPFPNLSFDSIEDLDLCDFLFDAA